MCLIQMSPDKRSPLEKLIKRIGFFGINLVCWSVIAEIDKGTNWNFLSGFHDIVWPAYKVYASSKKN